MYGGLWLPRNVGSGVLVVDVSGEDPLLSDESSYSVTTQMVMIENKYNHSFRDCISLQLLKSVQKN